MTTEQHILPGGEIIEMCWYTPIDNPLINTDSDENFLMDGEFISKDDIYDYVDTHYSNNALNEVTDYFRTCVD